jgi:hypothetical protein
MGAVNEYTFIVIRKIILILIIFVPSLLISSSRSAIDDLIIAVGAGSIRV